MCQGHRLHELPDATWPPASSPTTSRARVAASNAELVAVRARLAESMAQLERERERAAELRRRLTESSAERKRLKEVLSALVAMKGRVRKKRSRMEEASISGIEISPTDFLKLKVASGQMYEETDFHLKHEVRTKTSSCHNDSFC